MSLAPALLWGYPPYLLISLYNLYSIIDCNKRPNRRYNGLVIVVGMTVLNRSQVNHEIRFGFLMSAHYNIKPLFPCYKDYDGAWEDADWDVLSKSFFLQLQVFKNSSLSWDVLKMYWKGDEDHEWVRYRPPIGATPFTG